jgi:triosephosphate isomerase
VALSAVADRLKGSGVAVAAQDCAVEVRGAFTAEVAPEQIADAGGHFVILGHSERRQLFGEKDETVARKIAAAYRAGLQPIVCVGETLAERDAGTTLARVGAQLDATLGALSVRAQGCVVAYEPVWAIGTGRNATPGQAVEVHRFIRGRLLGALGQQADVRILYGGSVKPDNIMDLMAEDEIDGALVGGASLTVESFTAIVKKGTEACS